MSRDASIGSKSWPPLVDIAAGAFGSIKIWGDRSAAYQSYYARSEYTPGV